MNTVNPQLFAARASVSEMPQISATVLANRKVEIVTKKYVKVIGVGRVTLKRPEVACATAIHQK